ncbi:phosphate propanoyltransferase [Shigella flexneri]|nr:phosphate propanoyltransferase [Escherichia coli]
MEREQISQLISTAIDYVRMQPIPVGVSSRHVHLSEQDHQKLFPRQPLAVKKALKQPGQFAAEQTVTLKGPRGEIAQVRVLGPLRSQTQVEVSLSDARALGVHAPIRLSGDLENSAGIVLQSQWGEVALAQGVIVARRHIHMSPLEAMLYGVTHGDSVQVVIRGTERKLIFDDVSVRVADDMRLEMHIDTDEANAANLNIDTAVAHLYKKS